MEFQRGNVLKGFFFFFFFFAVVFVFFKLKPQVTKLVSKGHKNCRLVQARAANLSRVTHCYVTLGKSLNFSETRLSLL